MDGAAHKQKRSVEAFFIDMRVEVLPSLENHLAINAFLFALVVY